MQELFANKTEVIQSSNKNLLKKISKALKTRDYTKILKLIRKKEDLTLYSNDPEILKFYSDKNGVGMYTFTNIISKIPNYNSYQFAFIGRNKIKCLYSPDTELFIPPPNYLSFGKFSNKKNEINNDWYKIIVGEIKNNNLSNDLIEKFLNESYFLKKYFFFRRKNKETIKCLIASYNHEIPVIQQEIIVKKTLSSLVKDYKFFAEPFENLPFVSLTCELKDYESLEEKISKEFPVKIYKQTTVMLPKVTASEVRRTHTRRTHTNLEQIGAYDAHKVSKGKGVKVGVIDTGVDYEHEELKHLFEDCKGYNFVNDAEPLDDNGHGTHVAGIIGGLTTGVAPNCTLYSLKVLNKNGVGNNFDILKAIDWSISNGLDVINLSLGNPFPSEIEHLTIKQALKNGVCVVAAAGNSGVKEYYYPASYDEVISTAAVNSKNEVADFSTYNDQINISAPGVEIFSTFKNNTYQVLSGTSMASPHVVGVLALILSLKSLSPEELKRELERTAQDLHNKLHYGAGLVRADQAVLDLVPCLV